MKTTIEQTTAPAEGDATPWGPVQTVHQYAEGVVSVTTVRHGGIWLSPARVQSLPSILRHAPTFKPSGLPGRWYEEDIDAILPVLALPELFTPQTVWNAVRTANTYRNSDPYPLTLACKAFLTLPESEPARTIAAAFERQFQPAARWERGSLSGEPGIPGWSVSLRRNGESKTVQFADYPAQQFYTDSELLSLTLPPLTEETRARLRAKVGSVFKDKAKSSAEVDFVAAIADSHGALAMVGPAPQVAPPDKLAEELEVLSDSIQALRELSPHQNEVQSAISALTAAEGTIYGLRLAILDRREQARRQAEAGAESSGAFDGFRVTSDADPGL